MDDHGRRLRPAVAVLLAFLVAAVVAMHVPMFASAGDAHGRPHAAMSHAAMQQDAGHEAHGTGAGNHHAMHHCAAVRNAAAVLSPPAAHAVVVDDIELVHRRATAPQGGPTPPWTVLSQAELSVLRL